MISTLLLSAWFGSAPAGDAFVEHKLSNGVRLSVLELKDAPKQTFLAFVPVGLAHDDAGRAQWSHLLEHMLIRTTDPEGLADGDIVFNGETSDGALRLDVHAPPKQATLAAAKMIAWLSANSFDADVLEREKKNIEGELQTTVPRGYSHKWATAAWAQIVRHGAKEARVLGDVTDATVEMLEEYADAKLELGPRFRIVAVGPLPADEVRRIFDSQLTSGGGLDSLANALGGNPRGPKKGGDAAPAAKPGDLPHGELSGTWDLPATHLLEWYLLPDATPADRTSAMLLANLVAMKLQADGELSKAKIVALATADVALPQGRLFMLSASLPDAGARELAAKAFRRAIDGIEQAPPGGSLDAFVTMARNELSGFPDFKALRKQWSGRPGAELVEAQIVLALSMRESSSGLSFGELGAATNALTAKELLERRDRDLAADRASRLLLTPRR